MFLSYQIYEYLGNRSKNVRMNGEKIFINQLKKKEIPNERQSKSEIETEVKHRKRKKERQ